MSAHLFKEENETIHVYGLEGHDQRRAVENTLVDMYHLTHLTKGSKNAIFHVAISPREHESLTAAQKEQAKHMIAERFGLTDQMMFDVDHMKEGRAHTHVFWSAVDTEKGKLINLSHYKRKLQTLGKEMELEFGHEQTPRRKTEQSFEVTNGDRMRQNRTKEKALERKQEVTALWQQSDSAKSFVSALREKGYEVAKGDRSKFALVDAHGHVSNLVRDLPKTIKTKDVMAHFGEEYAALQSVDQAKTRIAARQHGKEQGRGPGVQHAFEASAKQNPTRATRDHRQKTKAGEKKKNEKAYEGISLDSAARRGLDHFLERKSSIGLYQLTHYVHSNSRYTRTEVEEALKKDHSVIMAERGGKAYATTREAVQYEEHLIAHANEGKNTCAPINNAYTPKQDFLNEGQRNAIQHILTSRDQITIISGAAGVGKTSLMREVKDGIEEVGKTLHAFAPSSNASRGVLREKGFEGADTIASLLQSKTLQAQIQNGVILIDEAGMVGNKTMNRIFSIAKEKNARVILSGDQRQHSSPEAGDALRILEEHSNLTVGRISKIVRQKNEPYRAAVDHLAKGQSENGFQALQAMGSIKTIYEDQARYDQLAKDYITSRKQGRSVLVVSPTHAEGKAVSDTIRAALKSQGMIGKDDHTYTTQRSLSLTNEQKRQAQSYRGGMSVQFHRSVPGFMVGQSYTVDNRSKGGPVTVRDGAGNVQRLPLDAARSYQVFETQETRFAIGDRLKITGNGKTMDNTPLNNGEVHTIKGFDKHGHIVFENGKTLSKDYKNMTLGYYETSHASQGKDAQDVFVAQGSRSFMASNAKQFYVSVSRGSESVRIYTDDADGLKQAVDKSGDRMTAREIAAQTARIEKMKAQRAWDGFVSKELDTLQEQLNTYYDKDTLINAQKALKHVVQNSDSLIGKITGQHQKHKDALQALNEKVKDVDQTITQYLRLRRKELEKQKPAILKPKTNKPKNRKKIQSKAPPKTRKSPFAKRDKPSWQKDDLKKGFNKPKGKRKPKGRGFEPDL